MEKEEYEAFEAERIADEEEREEMRSYARKIISYCCGHDVECSGCAFLSFDKEGEMSCALSGTNSDGIFLIPRDWWV